MTRAGPFSTKTVDTAGVVGAVAFGQYVVALVLALAVLVLALAVLVLACAVLVLACAVLGVACAVLGVELWSAVAVARLPERDGRA